MQEGNMKFIGPDVGDKRIGIAASDVLRCTIQGITLVGKTSFSGSIDGDRHEISRQNQHHDDEISFERASTISFPPYNRNLNQHHPL